MLTIDTMIPWIELHRTHLWRIEKQNLLSAYCSEIRAEFELIRPFLPPAEQVSNWVDIGCGLAGIDILLQKHYPKAKMYLLDSNGPAHDWTGGWRSYMKPFNNIKLMLEFLAINGVEPTGILDCDTDVRLNCPLVISFLSWGFHYPLSNYKVTSNNCIATLRNREFAPIFDRNVRTPIVIHSTSKYQLTKFAYDNSTG